MPITIVPAQIEAYAAAHTTPLPPLLQELVETTQRELPDRATMLCGDVEGTLLQMLVAMSGALRVLEIGMFTGFSAQMMAAALPDDGRIITCDIEPRHIEIARRFFVRSPHRHKIDVREGPALDTMKTLEPASFDLIFIDADKGNYTNYYEASLPLLAANGTIVVDNVLWSGNVLDPKERDDHAIVAFNDHVRADSRVTCVMLTVRDGVTLIRKRTAAP
ncbi:MAG: class I SAM-dependent methyltransferase [Dehalococcoidia bacterium]